MAESWIYIIAMLAAVILFMCFAIFGKVMAIYDFQVEVLTRSPCIGCGVRWEEVTLADGVKGLSRDHLPNCHMREDEES